MDKPESFLELIVHDIAEAGDDLAMCAGFERGVWRSDRLADHVLEWLPEFALNYTDYNSIEPHNAYRMLRNAAKTVYQTDKYGKRGEFGEILLHIAIRQVYDTIPAVSKIFYKTAANETVKGFDAVHVVRKDDELQLWIGETKFYKDINKAITDVVTEIVDHLGTNYLKSEFILIKNKIDGASPEAEELSALLSENNSLDKVFARVCVPVLLTFESIALKAAVVSDEAYITAIRAEIQKKYAAAREKLGTKYFAEFGEDLPVTVHIFLIPLDDKETFTEQLDAKLKGLQV